MENWINNAIFYHIYPLGFCGAPSKNDYHSQPEERLYKIIDWVDHFKKLGINALYLGPVFESVEHGYDTTNYFEVDRRLGTNETLKKVIDELHKNNIKVILDGVFNHVGRDFFAFKDLQQNGEFSMFRNWFTGIDFSQRSPLGDPFSYETWDGNYNLVKLNLDYSYVEEHLFDATKMWIHEFDIDGLRLDAAESLTPNFMKNLSKFTKSMKPNFWLMGEVVKGDYNNWANPESLHSTTNYECYKGLYSSFNDNNLHEIAYSIRRQSGENGMYKNLKLYNFLDNHDVNRIATSLHQRKHLYPLHIMFFTMPGIPSIYYGSEWGIGGEKGGHNDMQLRPNLDLDSMYRKSDGSLIKTISKLSNIRKSSDALKNGDYNEMKVESDFFSFSRKTETQNLLILINISDKEKFFEFRSNSSRDLLNNDESFDCNSIPVPASWGRILEVK